MTNIGTIIYAQSDTTNGEDKLQLQVNAIKEWCNRSRSRDRKKADILEVFTDLCDDDHENRPGLRKALERLRDEDVHLLVVWSINRLGKSLKQIAPIINELAEIDKHFYTLTTLEPVNDATVQSFKSSHYEYMEGFFDSNL